MIKKIFKYVSVISLMVFLPFISFAQYYKGPDGPSSTSYTLGSFIDTITGIIGNSVIPLIFTLAFAFFIWGVVQYVLNDADEAKKEKGKSFMVWGIIALTVMFAVWGLVAILANTFDIDTTFVPQLPSVPK